MKTIMLAALIAAALASGVASAYAAAGQGQGREKVLICHRTLSQTNPYVQISISVAALPAHMAHGDAPSGQYGSPLHPSACPTGSGASSVTSGTVESGNSDVKGNGNSESKGKGKK